MSSSGLAEWHVETATLEWLEGMGYTVLHGPNIAPGEPAAERTDYTQVVLEGRLRDALAALNSGLPADAVDEAYRKLTRPDSPLLLTNNRTLHRLMLDGVAVQSQRSDGTIGSVVLKVVEFDNPEANSWVAVNQFTVIEGQNNRRADIVVFVNGLPLGVMELKNPADENATIDHAFHQLQTYKAQIPVAVRLQ